MMVVIKHYLNDSETLEHHSSKMLWDSNLLVPLGEAPTVLQYPYEMNYLDAVYGL